jgi:hypothetical protein
MLRAHAGQFKTPRAGTQGICATLAPGYMRAGDADDDTALAGLRRLWRESGERAETLAGFEAAPVREGLRLRRLAARRRRG